MICRKYLWTLLILNALLVTFSEDYIKATKIECSPSPKYFINHTCRLKPINRFKSAAFMETHIRNILRNVSVNIGLYARNDVNLYRPFLVNITQNMCWYLGKKTFGPYMKIFMSVLSEYTNVNHSCPLTGLLIARNLYLNRNLIPVPMPQGDYKVLFYFYEGYPLDYIGTVAYYAQILEKRMAPRNGTWNKISIPP